MNKYKPSNIPAYNMQLVLVLKSSHISRNILLALDCNSIIIMWNKNQYTKTKTQNHCAVPRIYLQLCTFAELVRKNKPIVCISFLRWWKQLPFVRINFIMPLHSVWFLQINRLDINVGTFAITGVPLVLPITIHSSLSRKKEHLWIKWLYLWF